MKFTLVLATFAAVVYGQTIGDIPACAQTCIENAVLAAGCSSGTDVACACANFNTVEAGSTSCVIAACGADVAINQVLPAVTALCANQ
ncbi:hypothetical protein CFAM422_006927 [Trichoderma lentiforme]|uniref:CFEM domain-containing protein n=1 Tax=Trichoderma lentiforme TaxID=1567552 RepID=A0A9P4XFD7_9HYPO|nr:hypothetical protein CFAM422_006927 [Trichoderma lentiforme]